MKQLALDGWRVACGHRARDRQTDKTDAVINSPSTKAQGFFSIMQFVRKEKPGGAGGGRGTTTTASTPKKHERNRDC